MIGLAEKGMERQLDKLWRSSFNDPMRVTRYFLKYRFRPENCLVFQKDGEVVSGLYLLEAKIRLEGKLFPVQYIYAASTLPNYRNQGCMSQLLEFAEELGRQRGMACSVLVPATQSLFLYYGKFGYETFFYTRNVKIEKSRLKAIAFGGKG